MASSSKSTTTTMKMISANVRGFRTNVGELTHNFVLKSNADVVFISETFLDDKVPGNFAIIPGYSQWHRKDRNEDGGGVALCHKIGTRLQVLDEEIPSELEVIIFRYFDSSGEPTLVLGCYRPPSQGYGLLRYINENLDALILKYKAKHVFIIGDLNPRNIQTQFNECIAINNLYNHVNFPTHISGSSLDPVLSDMSSDKVTCSSMGFVGTSDHVAVLTTLDFKKPRAEKFSRQLWKWESADWVAINEHLQSMKWSAILAGDIDNQVSTLTTILKETQSQFVPSIRHEQRTSDQPWFGVRCRAAARAKHQAWRRFKQHPSDSNKQRHRLAGRDMQAVQEWAIENWKEKTRNKLQDGSIGSKQWWSLVKSKQGEKPETAIPPLVSTEGQIFLTSASKAEQLGAFFSNKMTVDDPDRPPPSIPRVTGNRCSEVFIDKAMVESKLSKLDTNKATGPDGVSPLFLKKCAAVLAEPLSIIYNRCFETGTWPTSWKCSHVVPVHKKGSKSVLKNYRPVSLLPIISKVFESLILEPMQQHLMKNKLISSRQHGFLKNRSAADLHLLMTSKWSKALDDGMQTLVLAIDIEGAFDRVWHGGLLAKLESMGFSGCLLKLIRSYLCERTLKVILNGTTSNEFPIRAGVPQGSVLGPLLWNCYFNDALNLLPESEAYADDVTLSTTCHPSELRSTTQKFSRRLNLLSKWGEIWQVRFATDKTQFMVVWRAPVQAHISFGDSVIENGASVDILGVLYDKKLSFHQHITNISKKAAAKLTSLRRITWLVGTEELVLLYKSQIRSAMEFALLSWGGAAPTHLELLNKVQRRAEHLIYDDVEESTLPSLQHRRDVAGMTALYKIQIMDMEHLRPLRQPLRRVPRATRSAAADQERRALQEPRCKTLHHQLQFTAKFCKLWNLFVTSTPEATVSRSMDNLQAFKVAANQWLFEYNSI